MRAAQIVELGRPPSPGEASEPAAEAVLEVLAAPLNPIDVAVGNGRFYGGHPPLPYVPGCECVGRLSGELVWTQGGGMGVSRNGAMAERAEPGNLIVPLPDGADPVVAAALGIAGLAGWLPLAWRAPVRVGETVLVLGATGTAGHVAVQAAKLLGAGRVVAAGRNPAGLERALESGADAAVALEANGDLVRTLRDACGGSGPDLVVDPLWGEPAAAALEAAAPGARIVHLGQAAGATATITSAAVRGKQLELLGHSNFAVPPDVLAGQFRRLVGHAISGEISVEVERVPLDEVADAWVRQAAGAGRKLVLVP